MLKPAEVKIWFAKTGTVPTGYVPIPAATKDHPEAPDYLETLMETCKKDLSNPVYFVYLGSTLSPNHKKQLNQLQERIPNLSCVDFDELVQRILKEDGVLGSKVQEIEKFYKNRFRDKNCERGVIDLVNLGKIFSVYYSDLLSQPSKTQNGNFIMFTDFDRQCGNITNENLFTQDNDYLFSVCGDDNICPGVIASEKSRNSIFEEIINKIYQYLQHLAIDLYSVSCTINSSIKENNMCSVSCIINSSIKENNIEFSPRYFGVGGTRNGFTVSQEKYDNKRASFAKIMEEHFTGNEHHTWNSEDPDPIFYPSVQEMQEKLDKLFPEKESGIVAKGPSETLTDVIPPVNGGRGCVIL